MKKNILFVAGGLAAFSVIALPSPSAAVQEQEHTALQQKVQKLQEVERLPLVSEDKLELVEVDPVDLLEFADQAKEKYIGALQLVREMTYELSHIATSPDSH